MDRKNLSAWGISEAIYDIIQNGFAYDEETGEVYFTSDDLDSLQEALDTKIESICGVIKSKEEEYDALKKRSEEVLKSAKRNLKEAERLKNYLLSLMEMNGIEKTKQFGDYNLGVRRSNAVSISDDKEVIDFLNNNPEYSTALNVKTDVSISKTELKKFLTEGATIPGASIVTNKNVVIK